MQAVLDAPTKEKGWQFAPPAEVLSSRLFRSGGYFIVSGLFDEETLRRLREEAETSRPDGTRQRLAESDGAEGRGGSPARSYRSAPGRDLHWSLHGSPEMAEALRGLCGATVTASGSGNYSFYEEPGDFLALHRDILQCDIAAITALTSPAGEAPQGELTVYPGFIREPLSAVRAAGRRYGTPIPLERGQTVVLLGGLVPHEVTEASPGQVRIVAVNCYRIVCGEANDGIAQQLSAQ